ncbi:MAG: hypothetical protein IPO27_02195 [Bacteroidetes bacterium]|nr:hypothetical protein [Bacteroidota bacterium]
MQKKKSNHSRLCLRVVAWMLLVVLNVCNTFCSIAQAPIYQLQTLPIKGVNCFVEDALGMRWFGSNFGLVRYDGVRTKTFTFNINDTTSLCDNRIWCLAEDKKNRLWIGSQNGICVYNKKTDSFFRMPLLYDTLNRVLNEISNIKCAVDGSIIWTSRNSIFQTTLVDGVFISNSLQVNEKGFATFKYFTLALTEQHAWVVTNNNKVLRVNLVNHVSETEVLLKLPNGDALLNIEELKTDSGFFYFKTINAIYTATKDHVNQNVITTSELIKPFRVADNTLAPFYFCKNSKHDVWIASGGNDVLHYMRTVENNFILTDTISPNQDNLYFLKNEAINYIFHDDGGSIYFTSEKNVFVFRTDGLLFQSSKNFEMLLRTLNSSYVIHNMGLLNDTMVWATTSNNEFITINLYQPNVINKWKQLEGMQVNDMLKLDDRTYLCFAANGILLINKNREIETLNQSFAFDGLRTMQGEAWAVSASGVYRFGHGNKLTKVEPGTSYLKYARPRTLAQLDNNTVLAGTDLGAVLIKYDLLNATATNIECTRNSFVNSLAIIGDTVYIATNSGLITFDPATNKCNTLIGADSIIKSLLVYENNTLFISIEGIGLGRYEIKTGKLVLFESQNGILSNAFTIDGERALMLPDSTFCFSTDNGLNFFKPADVAYSKQEAIPYLNEFTVNTTRLLANNADPETSKFKKEYFDAEPLVFTYNQNDLHFTFSVVTHLPSNKFTFMYMLEGYDAAWKRSTVLEAFYTDVSPRYNSVFFPGTYTLLARTMNEAGQTYEMQAPMRIVIRTVWYRSLEFIGLLLLAAIVIAYYVVRYYSQIKLKQKIAEQEKLLAVERERNRISRDLHDDLGAGLSSIAMMTNMMKDLVENNDAHQHASDISTEANELVTRMREIIWSMSAKHDNVDSLVSYMQNYAEKYLRKNRMQLQMQTEGEVPHDYIDARMRENVFLVVKETLHNSVKYSGSKVVKILITSQPRKLKILIDDMGKGFDMQDIGKFGNGLSNMKNRMETISGTYSITSAPGKGTQTLVELNYSAQSKI